jgi:hypothetical protein
VPIGESTRGEAPFQTAQPKSQSLV